VFIAGFIIPFVSVVNIIRYYENILPFISHHFIKMILAYLGGVYVAFVVTIRSWDKIRASNFNKIKYCFTYPLFLLTYIPISIMAMFKDVTWVPIKHTQSKSIEELA
ncbi:MAG TPA: hypothetical protein VFC75_02570, partial [Erysipelothrix sp.]|nr:hypothetical protein [Erysipelothrix sp.]